MTSPYRPVPALPREACDLCGEPWNKHHVEPKLDAVIEDQPSTVMHVHYLVECPRGFGDELRDGRVPIRPPSGVILEGLRFPYRIER